MYLNYFLYPTFNETGLLPIFNETRDFFQLTVMTKYFGLMYNFAS